MKKLLLAAWFIAVSGPAVAQECGDVTVARMNWPTAEVIAQIDKIMLEAMGCNVQLVPGSTIPTLKSMIETGEPQIAPEAWIDAVREPLDRAVNDGRLVYASHVFAQGGIEGWWIPKHTAEAHPEIRTIEDALAHPDLFPHPTDPTKAAIHGCPAEWECHNSINNLFKAYDGQSKGFDLIQEASAADLDNSIIAAFEAKQGWLGYYWAPTPILGKYEMVLLATNALFDRQHWDDCIVRPDCDEPAKTAWPIWEVHSVALKSLMDRAPPVADYLNKRSLTVQQLSGLVAWMIDGQATAADGARYFVRNSPNVWTEWVAPDIAEKVRDAAL